MMMKKNILLLICCGVSFFLQLKGQTTLSAPKTLVCLGEDVVYDIAFSGQSAPYSVTVAENGISKTINNIYTNPLRRRLKAPASGSYTIAIGVQTIVIDVVPPPVISALDTLTVCDGTALATLTLTAPNVNGAYLSGSYVLNNKALPDSFSLIDAGKDLMYKVETAVCGDVYSSSLPLRVLKHPQVFLTTDIVEGQTYYDGQYIHGSVDSIVGGDYTTTHFRWFLGNKVICDDEVLSYMIECEDEGVDVPIGVKMWSYQCGFSPIQYPQLLTEDTTIMPANSIDTEHWDSIAADVFPIVVGQTFDLPTINYPAPYYFVTHNASLHGQTAYTVVYKGVSYQCSVVGNLDAAGVAYRNSGCIKTLFIDTGTYEIEVDGKIFGRQGLHLVGLDTNNRPIIQPKSNLLDTSAFYSPSKALMYHLSRMVCFENLIFDGQTLSLDPKGNAYGYFFTVEYGMETDGLILKNLHFKNVGSTATFSNYVNKGVLNIIGGPLRGDYGAFPKRYFIDLTFENVAALNPTAPLVSINNADGCYFKNLDISTISTNMAISIVSSYNYTDSFGGCNIIFDGDLLLPAAGVMLVMRYDSRRISFPMPHQYVVMSKDWNPTSETSHALIVGDSARLVSGYGSSTDYVYYDALEKRYLIRQSLNNINTQLANIKTVIDNFSTYCTFPPLNIRYIVEDSLTTPFTVPEFGQRTVNLSFQKGLFSHDEGLVPISTAISPIMTLSEEQTERLKINNLDFSVFDYYTVDSAVGATTNAVVNSLAGNFYNCGFFALVDDPILLTVECLNAVPSDSIDEDLQLTLCGQQLSVHSESKSIQTLSLYTVYGQSMLEKAVDDYSFSVDLSGYSASVYVLKIQFSDGTQLVKKICKQ